MTYEHSIKNLADYHTKGAIILAPNSGQENYASIRYATAAFLSQGFKDVTVASPDFAGLPVTTIDKSRLYFPSPSKDSLKRALNANKEYDLFSIVISNGTTNWEDEQPQIVLTGGNVTSDMLGCMVNKYLNANAARLIATDSLDGDMLLQPTYLQDNHLCFNVTNNEAFHRSVALPTFFDELGQTGDVNKAFETAQSTMAELANRSWNYNGIELAVGGGKSYFHIITSGDHAPNRELMQARHSLHNVNFGGMTTFFGVENFP